MTVKRTTQVVAESVSASNPNLRVSQVFAEMVSANALKLLATQVFAEVVSQNVPDDTGGVRPQIIITGM